MTKEYGPLYYPSRILCAYCLICTMHVTTKTITILAAASNDSTLLFFETALEYHRPQLFKINVHVAL